MTFRIEFFKVGELPTIVQRVCDLMNDLDNINKILNIIYNFESNKSIFSHSIDKNNRNLSTQFFEQMYKCGEICNQNYKRI